MCSKLKVDVPEFRSAAAPVHLEQKPVCQRQGGRNSVRGRVGRRCMSFGPVIGRGLPLTYGRRAPDEVSSDLSSPSHLTSSELFSRLPPASPFTFGFCKKQHFQTSGHHVTSDSRTSRESGAPMCQPCAVAYNCKLAKFIAPFKGNTALEEIICHVSDWLNETLKNAIS